MLAEDYVAALLRMCPWLTLEKAQDLEARLRDADLEQMAEQTQAEIDALPTVKP